MTKNRKSAKEILNKIPVIGYSGRLTMNNLKLPIHLNRINQHIHSQAVKTSNLNNKIIQTNEQIIELKEINHILMSELSKVRKSINNLEQYSLQNANTKIAPSISQASNNKPALLADNHDLDDFYIKFENEFRGSEIDILNRLNVYSPYFNKIRAQNSKHPVLDIGCGRGEFLQFMKNNKYDAVGLDLNKSMVESSKLKGFKVIEDNAITFLAKEKERSYSAITGFHLVEHIQFADLIELLQNCYKALAVDGFALFETPNPENLSVGAFSFYYDPSHLRPIPPKFLKFCFNYVGFRDVKIIRLHPALEKIYKDEIINGVVKKLYGPQDYAVIGYK